MNLQELSESELIRIYVKAAANESSSLPFGAEERRKAAGDELLRRGIREIYLPIFVDPFPVRGSESDARKCTEKLVPGGKAR